MVYYIKYIILMYKLQDICWQRVVVGTVFLSSENMLRDDVKIGCQQLQQVTNGRW